LDSKEKWIPPHRHRPEILVSPDALKDALEVMLGVQGGSEGKMKVEQKTFETFTLTDSTDPSPGDHG
jgi:hypothetical protein